MPLAKANGTTLHYRFDGPDTGDVIMFSNSLATNLYMWDDQVSPLCEAGYRVLRYDTRGHGQSSAPPGPYSIDMLALDALSLLNELGLDKVHFCGISLGGMTGQVLGTKHGERFRSLILCDTSTYMPPPEQWNERIALIRRSGTGPVANTAIDRWFTQSGQERLKTQVEKCRHMILDTLPEGYCGCCTAIRDLDLREAIRTISAPTLVVVGKEDPATTVDDARFIHERITASSLVVIPDAAHLSNIEQAGPFNAALLDFLGRHP